jgi:uncharacterized protein
MFLDTNEIDDDGLSFDHHLELADLQDLDGGPMAVTTAWLRGRVSRSTQRLDLTASLDASVRVTCGRCLEVYDLPLATRFSLRLVSQPPGAGAGGVGVDDDEAAAAFHAPGGRADLGLMATEQIYLNLPMKRVCREDCRGLCPSCGFNLNHGDCGCIVEAWDPWRARLREIESRLSSARNGKHDA